MLRSRNGRPGLIGTAARTAVVMKTANAVNSRDAQKQAARAQAATTAAPVTTATAEPPPAPTGLTDDGIARLKQLGELNQAGILTDTEFAEAKARILNG
jgi:hypothetical protein